MFLGVIIFQVSSSQVDWSENMAARGVGGYSENFKNLLQKHLADFPNYYLEMFLGRPSFKFLQAIMISKKNMAPKGRAVLHYMAIDTTFKLFSSESIGPICK